MSRFANQTQPGLLIVGSFLGTAPLERYVSGDIALRLADSGWRVTATSQKVGRFSRLADMLFTIWRTRHTYAVCLVDVFSGPAFFWAEWSARLLQRLGKPFVLTLHGGNLPVFAHKHPARVRRLLSSAAQVTTPSSYLHDAMRPHCEALVLLPNALDLERYVFRLRATPEPRLVWLRAFEATYNPVLACLVVALLTTEHPQVRLTMTGPDKGDGSLGKLKAEIRKLKLEAQVRLEGAVPKSEVPGVLNQGDIFLNTTNVDNTPVSVIEAMACGLCVVSTNVGGMAYLIEHERDGLLVPPNDENAMVKAVGRVLKEPGLAERLSQNARAKAEQFDWTRILPQWERLLMDILPRGPGNRRDTGAGIGA